MSHVVGPITPSLISAQIDLQTNTSWATAVIINESPYQLRVTQGSGELFIQPWFADKVQLDGSGKLTYVAQAIGSIAGAPTNALYVMLYGPGEAVPGVYPSSLNRLISIQAGTVTIVQPVTVTVTGTPAVTITGTPNVNITAGAVQIKNISGQVTSQAPASVNNINAVLAAGASVPIILLSPPGTIYPHKLNVTLDAGAAGFVSLQYFEQGTLTWSQFWNSDATAPGRQFTPDFDGCALTTIAGADNGGLRIQAISGALTVRGSMTWEQTVP